MANFLSTLFGGGAEAEAADKNRQLAGLYGTQSQGYLTDAYNTGTGYLKSSLDAYGPLAGLGTKYSGAGDTWLDALGVNGPGGNTRAQQAFQTTPGYELARNQGTAAIDRRRAISGMYASGNADQDTADYVTNLLYSSQYQPWMQGLQSAAGMGGQLTGAAAQGIAGGYGNLASLGQQYAQNQTGVAGNVLGQNVNANNLQAAGEAQGAKNLLGAGLSLATAGMGAFGGGGGGAGGGLFSSIGNLFSSSPTGQTFGGYGTGSYGSGMMGGIRYPAV